MDKENNLKIIRNDSINFSALFSLFVDGKKMIVRVSLIFLIISIFYSLLITPLFKSSISVYPSDSSSSYNLGQFQGIASNLGIGIPQSGKSLNITDLVKSRRLYEMILNKNWTVDNTSFNLIKYWKIDNDSFFSLNPITMLKKMNSNNSINKQEIYIENAILEIANRISVDESSTGLITISVLMENPKLSSMIANYIYDAIKEISNSSYSEQAVLNRKFIEQRQDIAQSALIKAEEKLRDFRTNNINVSDSPQLQLEFERLLRQVEIQTQVYITLTQQYEIARIDEVKDTPSVILLDDSITPVKKHSPRRMFIVLISTFFGAIISLVAILFKHIRRLNG